MTGTVLRNYPREWLRPDVIAGLTAAAVVVPKALAYATIAGLPVQVGLYTAFVPMVIYALLGSSRPLSVSTTTTIAILTASALALAGHGGAPAELAVGAATLSVMVGVVLVLANVLRLGFVANFISEPVLAGFKTGIGLVIVVDQVPKLLGIHIEKAGFFRDLLAIVQHVPQASQATVLLSVGILALIFGLERFLPKWPAPLVAVGAAILASALLGLQAAGVATVGEVPRGLPSLTWPQLELVSQLWPAAIGIALMSFTESIAAGRAFADPKEPRPLPNRELLALGIANVGPLVALVSGVVVAALLVAVFFGTLWASPSHLVLGLLLTLVFSFFFASVAANAIATTARNPVSGMTMLTIIIASVVLLRFGVSGQSGMFFVMALAGVVAHRARDLGPVRDRPQDRLLAGLDPGRPGEDQAPRHRIRRDHGGPHDRAAVARVPVRRGRPRRSPRRAAGTAGGTARLRRRYRPAPAREQPRR